MSVSMSIVQGGAQQQGAQVGAAILAAAAPYYQPAVAQDIIPDRPIGYGAFGVVWWVINLCLTFLLLRFFASSVQPWQLTFFFSSLVFIRFFIPFNATNMFSIRNLLLFLLLFCVCVLKTIMKMVLTEFMARCTYTHNYLCFFLNRWSSRYSHFR